MRELLLGAVCGKDLIQAEQVGLIRFALELVGVAGEPDPNLLHVRIAWRADTSSRLHVLPRPGQIGEYVLETVKSVLDAIFSGEASSGDVANPGVHGVQGTDDLVIEMFGAATEKVPKAVHGIAINFYFKID